jgi:hypothetical protein
MEVVAGARNKVTTYAQRMAASLDQRLMDQEEKNDQYVSQMFDQVKIASVKKVRSHPYPNPTPDADPKPRVGLGLAPSLAPKPSRSPKPSPMQP